MARKSKSKTPREIEFDLIKSSLFRVIHADGAIGGASPQGNIHMALYNERRAIPTKIVHAVEDSKLGPEITSKRQGRSGMVREVEVDVVLGLEEARALQTWLADKISQIEKLIEQQPDSHLKRSRKK
jgi:hypothetical protein